MEVDEVAHTCSMAELGGGLSIDDFTSLGERDLDVTIKEEILCRNINIDPRKIRCILYNTKFTFLQRLYIRIFHGFKTIGSYKNKNNEKIFITIKKVKWEE